MHVYVQKSISTTRPRSFAIVSGAVLNHCPVSAKSGASPSTGSLRRLHAGQRGVDRLVGLRCRDCSANFALPRRSASSRVTRPDVSRPFVGFVRKAGRWSGERAFEAQVDACEHQHGGEEHHGADRPLERGSAPGSPDAIHQLATADREAEQHDRRAEAAGDPDGDDPRRGARGRTGDDDGARGSVQRRARRRSRARRRRAGPTRSPLRRRAVPGAAGTSGAAAATAPHAVRAA